MTTETFAHIPLSRIVASTTNPRKHFDPARMAELAESIRASGVHQPVLLRPLPASRLADTTHMDPRPDYELVSGERRYRASEAAGKATIPAMVRPLTDSEVLEIQVVENLQRDDLHPLEEAEGYERLMHAHEPPLTAEQIGERIGKSRSYVYARLKLLNLCPEGQQAMRDGWLEPSTALLVARAPSTKLQNDILGNLKDWRGEVISHREAAALIERQYMLRLSEAKLKITDETLLAHAGSCKTCPKRTGADPDLFADVKGADVCTDPVCFKAKSEAHSENALKAARESGATIVEGREAQQITLRTADGRLDGYLRLDDKRDSPEKGQTLRQIIGHLLWPLDVKPTLIAMPDHEPVAAITTAEATRLLSIKADADKTAQLVQQADQGSKSAAKAAEELQKRKDHEHYWNTWTWRLMERAWAKISAMDEGMYSLPEAAIRLLARDHLPKAKDRAERLCEFLKLGKVAPAPALADWVNEHPDPDRALALIMLFNGATTWKDVHADHNPPSHYAMVIAEDRGVDVKVSDIKAEVEAEHTADIRARNKVQAEKAQAKAETADLPLPPAAQAGGVRGGSKLKKTGTPAAPKRPKTTPEEALQGIAAAMQGEGGSGGDCAPAGSEPVGASAEVPEGRATAPGAGAADAVPGEPDPLVSEASGAPAGAAEEGRQFEAGCGVVVTESALAGRSGKVLRHLPNGEIEVQLEGLSSPYRFNDDELAIAPELNYGPTWPYPGVGP